MTDTFHVYPAPEQIKNGNDLASGLYDASVAKALGLPIPNHPKFQQLIDQYLAGEIDAVTAIFMAMNEGTYEWGSA